MRQILVRKPERKRATLSAWGKCRDVVRGLLVQDWVKRWAPVTTAKKLRGQKYGIFFY
jgi:hypothetical protein